MPAAGPHVISVGKSSLTVPFKDCSAYYVRIDRSSKHSSPVSVQLVDNDVGEEETRKLQEARNDENK